MNGISMSYAPVRTPYWPTGLLNDWHWRRMDGLHRLALQTALVVLLLAASVLIGESGNASVPGPTQTVAVSAPVATV